MRKRCRLTFPVLSSLYKKYEEAGLEIISFNPFDKRVKDVLQTIDRQHLKYPIIMTDTTLLKLYGVFGYPTIFVVDSSAKIIHTVDGYSAELEAELNDVIKKQLTQGN